MKNTDDITTTLSGGWSTYTTESIEPNTLTAIVDSLDVKIGKLEITSDDALVFNSHIKIDGKDFPVKSIKLEGDAKGLWTVTLQYYPGLMQV